jgi:hypothetical protein
MSVAVSKVIEKLELIKSKLILNTTIRTDEQNIYINYCCRDFLKDLNTLDSEIDDMMLTIKDPETNYAIEIDNKQQNTTNTIEFMKTFSPLFLLHNMGFIHRNWE